MIEGLSFLFEPFDSFGVNVAIWYVATVVVMSALQLFVEDVLGIEIEHAVDRGTALGGELFAIVVAAPIVEESLFRIAPMLAGAEHGTVVGLSIAWAFMHGKRFVFVLLMVPLFVKLALGGFFIELVAVHAFHNLWTTALVYAKQ